MTTNFKVQLRRRKQSAWAIAYALIALVFVYTTVVKVIERPDGIKIAGFFIGLIIRISGVSRISRTTELRVKAVEIDGRAQRFIDEAANKGTLRIITNPPSESEPEEYRREISENREAHNLSLKDPILFLEVEVCDASDFADVMKVEGKEVGTYRVLRAESSAVPKQSLPFCFFCATEPTRFHTLTFTGAQRIPWPTFLIT